MPYIEQKARMELHVRTDRDIKTPGELNYAITMLVNQYLGADLNYQLINDVLGALDGAAKEFYRRVAVPYEDVKLSANGEVFRAR